MSCPAGPRFGGNWGDFDTEECGRALWEYWHQKNDDNVLWLLPIYSTPEDTPKLLSVFRQLENKDGFTSALLSNAGADDLFAEKPSGALEHVQSQLSTWQEMGFLVTSPQEQKAFAALKTRKWDQALRLLFEEEFSKDPGSPFTPYWRWAQALQRGQRAGKGGSTEACVAFALCLGVRRLLFLGEKLLSLSLLQLFVGVINGAHRLVRYLREADHKQKHF